MTSIHQFIFAIPQIYFFDEFGNWWIDVTNKIYVMFVLIYSNAKNWGKKSFFGPIRSLFIFFNWEILVKKFVKTCCELDIYLLTRARSYIPGNMKMIETFTKQKQIAINKQKTTIFIFQGPLERSWRSWVVYNLLSYGK